MTKNQVLEIIKSKGTAKEKEEILKRNNVTFTHDSQQRLIVWCSDGVIEFSPIFKR